MSIDSKAEADGFAIIVAFFAVGMGSALLAGGLVNRFGGNFGECFGGGILVGFIGGCLGGWVVGSLISSAQARAERAQNREDEP